MTNEEMASLIQAGHREYKAALWLGCSGFVRKKAVGFKTAHERCRADVDDLISAGYLAFERAIRYFKPDLHLKFLTFLARPLQTEFLRECGWLTSRRDVLEYAESLDYPAFEDDDESPLLIDLIASPDDEYFETVERMFRQHARKVLKQALSTLSDKQQMLLRAMYFDGMTETEAGVFVGYPCKQATESAHYSALRKLRTGRYGAELRQLYDNC